MTSPSTALCLLLRVKLGEHLQTREQIAVKILNFSRVDRRDVRKEMVLHKMASHPNIVRWLGQDPLPDNTAAFLLMELARGGELFDRIGGGGACRGRIVWLICCAHR